MYTGDCWMWNTGVATSWVALWHDWDIAAGNDVTCAMGSNVTCAVGSDVICAMHNDVARGKIRRKQWFQVQIFLQSMELGSLLKQLQLCKHRSIHHLHCLFGSMSASPSLAEKFHLCDTWISLLKDGLEGGHLCKHTNWTPGRSQDKNFPHDVESSWSECNRQYCSSSGNSKLPKSSNHLEATVWPTTLLGWVIGRKVNVQQQHHLTAVWESVEQTVVRCHQSCYSVYLSSAKELQVPWFCWLRSH